MSENRIRDAVSKISTRLAGVDADALARCEEAATLDAGEWLLLGDRPSRSMLEGKITLDEANTLHMIHTNFNNGASLAQRIVFLQVMTEVIS